MSTLRILTSIGGIAVHWDGQQIRYLAGMAIDADGSPRAYHPNGKSGLDYLSNAGRPGNWWALVTDTGDPGGRPVIQAMRDPAPGFFISTTAYEDEDKRRTDPARYLDSEKVIFAVIPAQLRTMVGPVVLGAKVEMRNLETGLTAVGIVGDIGPRSKIGEASIAAAKALGVPHDPRTGGTSRKSIAYTITPGVSVPPYELKPAERLPWA